MIFIVTLLFIEIMYIKILFKWPVYELWYCIYISLWGGMTKYLHFTTRIPRYIVYGYHCYGVGISIAFKIFNYFWFPRGGDLMTPSSHDLCIIWWAMTLEQRYVYSLWMGILTLLINSGPWGEGMLSNHPKNTVIPRVHDRVWH